MSSSQPAIDILLFNLSNPPAESIYPYAFVQFRAWARQCGVVVKTIEMSYVEKPMVAKWLKAHIEREQPRAVLFLLRQTDTQRIEDYARTFAPASDVADRFPTAVLAEAVQLTRAVSSCPIGLIGRGFAVAPQQLVASLEVDFGVRDNGEQLLKHWQNFLNDQRLSIPNLILRNGDGVQSTPHVFNPPTPFPEYDAAQINDFISHYGRIFCFGRENLRYHHRGLPFSLGIDLCTQALLSPRRHIPTVPVEVARGWSTAPCFSPEPALSGDRVLTRDLKVIDAELNTLIQNGFRRFWFVAPLLNAEGSEWLRDLAQRMIAHSGKLKEQPLEWGGFLQPHGLSHDDLDLLYQSGFTSSALEVPSLDDDHLAALGMPFRTEDVIAFHRNDAAVRAQHGISQRLPFCLSLGTPGWTPVQLARTQQRFHEAGLAEVCDDVVVIHGRRVYPSTANRFPQETLLTFGPEGRRDVDPVSPTFFTPPELRDGDHFDAAYTFMNHLAQSTLRRVDPERADWPTFLARHSRPEQLQVWLQALVTAPNWQDVTARLEAWGCDTGERDAVEKAARDPRTCRALTNPTGPQKQTARQTTACIIRLLNHHHQSRLQPLLASLEGALEDETHPNSSTYSLLCRLNRSYRHRSELIDALCRQHDIAADTCEIMLVQAHLFAKRVFIDRRLRPLLLEEQVPV